MSKYDASTSIKKCCKIVALWPSFSTKKWTLWRIELARVSLSRSGNMRAGAPWPILQLLVAGRLSGRLPTGFERRHTPFIYSLFNFSAVHIHGYQSKGLTCARHLLGIWPEARRVNLDFHKIVRTDELKILGITTCFIS